MSDTDIEQEISNYIARTFLAGEYIGDLAGFDLLQDGVLDSLSCLRLASWLEDFFDISIGANEITSENFNSLASIQRLVSSKIPNDS